jgi:Immunoglobulin-like domain of bacterial spore germination/Sporulation and spore germination
VTEKWTPEEEERLRRALHEEASKVFPAPGGLERILAKTRRTRGWLDWWRSPAVLGVAAAVTAAVVIGAGLYVIRDTGDITAGPGLETSAPTEPGTPSPEPTEDVETYTEPAESSPSPSVAESEPTGGYSGAVPVYYVADQSGELRLAREWRRVETPRTAPEEAVALLFEPSRVPEYDSLWNPATEVRSVEIRDGAITVDLSLPGSDPVAGDAQLAVQQLVYTATASVSLTGGDGALPVRVLDDGAPAGQLSGVDISGDLHRAPALEVRQLVQLNDPYQGETVTSPVRIGGDAAVVEATVLWELLRDGEPVDSSHTMAEVCCEFAEFGFELDLEPGEYTIVVSESDLSDGEGRPPMSDARTFVVTD